MRIGLIRVGLLVYIISLCGSAYTQTPTPSQSSGSIESAIAIEDPAARIEALQKFLETRITPEQSQTAREAIVASWAQLAERQLGGNEIEKAVADFRRAIAALPGNITDRFFDDIVIRIPQAVSVRGYRNEAIELARQLEKRFTGESGRLAGIGEFYVSIEAPSDAIRALEAAVKLSDRDARLRRSLGAAYRIGLRLDDAIAEYQRAVGIDPNDKRAYYELANLYRAHGAYQDAARLYQKQVALEPKHLPSYKGMALAYLAQNDVERASAVLNQVRSMTAAEKGEDLTQDFYLQTQLAFYQLKRGDLKQARQAAESALRVEPRYAWALIAAAEVELAEGRYFEAERSLLAAKKYANFPTLFFTLGKLYLSVEDFDGALEQFTKAFSYSPPQQFTARLGGVLDLHADDLKELLSREHQATIFIADPPTSDEQFKIVGSLVRFDFALRAIKDAAVTRAAKGKEKVDADLRRRRFRELDRAAIDFIEAERTRGPFRALHIAQQLAQAGVATESAVDFADQALGLAEVATQYEGSVRDYPNYDREGRLRIFRGRALDAKGWARFKAGKNREALAALAEAVRAYDRLPEGKRALRHLAAVKETIGELADALDLYIAGYEPPAANSDLDLNRAVIEGLYRKVTGSLKGLDERLKRASGNYSTEVEAILAGLPPTGPPESNASPQTSRSSSDSMPVVPATDTAVAKEGSTDKLSGPKPADQPAGEPAIAPAAPETVKVVKTPVVLPKIEPELGLLQSLIPIASRQEPLAILYGLNIDAEENSPPIPPVARTQEQGQTRGRRVTGTNTRKRRVTVPDDQQDR